MAGLTGTTGKALLSGRALVVVALCAGLAGWGAYLAHRAGLAWDATGRGFGEDVALVAELRPDAQVTLVGPTPLERLLLPLSRHTGRLHVTTVDAARVATLSAGPRFLEAGDVQVRAGEAWVVLHRPDLPGVLAALVLLSAPDVQAVGKAPLDALGGPRPPARPGGGGSGDVRLRALAWAITGLLMPLAVAIGGVWWRVRRRGR